MRYLTALLFLLLTHTALCAGQVEEDYFDVTYGNRTLPIKVYALSGATNSPLIIYSHGLGGSRETKKYLLEYWAETGFICVSVQHPGSDTDVFKNAKRGEKFKALKHAASAEQFLNRSRDIPAVLDQLEKWNADVKHKLHNSIDFSRVGMCGHSFGAITSQVMMGARYCGLKDAGDDRFKAFLLMSPSPAKGNTPEDAFGHVTRPVLCMTGTADKSPIQSNVGYKERVSVYKALPAGNKYLYVFEGGTHNLFSGPTRFRKTLTDEHKLIQELTLLFWQTHLLNDDAARTKLLALKPQEGDQWLTPKIQK